jgi:hypothetical protein
MGAAAKRNGHEKSKDAAEDKSWRRRLKDTGTWWYYNWFAEPTVAALETVMGRCPDRVAKKLLNRDENPKVGSRFWAGVHGLVHVVMGAIPPSKMPKRLLKFHWKVKLKAHPELDPVRRITKELGRLMQEVFHRSHFGGMSDKEIADHMEEKLQPAFERGTPPWAVVGQAVERLRRADGGPATDDGIFEVEVEERGGAEVAAAAVAPPRATSDEPEYVPTPSNEEFAALMDRLTAEGTSPPASPATPTEGEKKNGEETKNKGGEGRGGPAGTVP